MRVITSLLIVLLPLAGYSQLTTGTIIYEAKRNMHKMLKDKNPEALQFVPEFQTSLKALHFTKDAYVYKNHTSEDSEEMRDGGVMIKIDAPENVLYRDLANNRKVDQRDFMGRIFLIDGDIDKPAWKVGNVLEEISGFPCMTATYTNEEKKQTIKAWFTASIPVSAGPEGIDGLPGMILKLTINDDDIIYVAKEIDSEAPAEGLIVAPEKGKKVSDEKFQEIVQQKMEEMGAQGGNVIIKMQKN